MKSIYPTRSLVALAVVALLSALVGGCRKPARPVRDAVREGMTRQQVLELLGEPEQRSQLVTGSAIWGPEETWLGSLPGGTSLDQWRYRDIDGVFSVYFFDGKDRVEKVFFYPAGVVYEGSAASPE